MSSLPPLPRSIDALVVVTTLLNQSSKDRLEHTIRGPDSGWPSNTVIIYCVDNFFQRQLEKHGRQGSIGQIYNIASNAFAMGRDRIILVDALTSDQLTGKVRPGRSKDVSIVYVQIDRATKHKARLSSVKDTTVWAKRLNIDTVPWMLKERTSVSWGTTYDWCDRKYIRTPQQYYDAGMLLYDANKPVYDKTFSPSNTSDDFAHAMAQILSLDPPLPAELTDKITAYAQGPADMGPMTAAAAAKHTLDRKKIEIHLLVPLESGELENLQKTYNEELTRSPNRHIKDIQCVMHPRFASRLATRSDLWHLFQRMCDKTTERRFNILVFAGWPGWQKSQENHGEPPATRRLPITEVANVWREIYTKARVGWDAEACRDFKDPDFEFLLDPNAPFFHNPSQFQSLEKGVVMVPVFCMTRQMPPKDMSTIREKFCGLDQYADMYAGTVFPMDFYFVQWASEKDGTVEDMWHLLWHYMQHNGLDLPHRSCAAIFIDQQTLSDGKVIVAQVAANIFRNHLDFEDLLAHGYIDQPNYYVRPGAVWSDSDSNGSLYDNYYLSNDSPEPGSDFD
ncbi:MAG: hypothetical protein Q9218_004823 [Villophora microphyllina]